MNLLATVERRKGEYERDRSEEPEHTLIIHRLPSRKVYLYYPISRYKKTLSLTNSVSLSPSCTPGFHRYEEEQNPSAEYGF